MLRPPTPARLVLIRGLPGSGKSTLATEYQSKGYRHIEADQFFINDGEYRFNPEQLAEAHAWCLRQARLALKAGEFVCIANVFATADEIKPYTQLGSDWQVVEASYDGQSIHAVPTAALRAMRTKWVSTTALLATLKREPMRSIISASAEPARLDLTFPMVAYGRIETPWDLRVLLYKGASCTNYRTVFNGIADGRFGQPMTERIALVKGIHEEMAARLVAGGDGARATAFATFRAFRALLAFADRFDLPFSLETVETTYRHWTDFLLNRVRLKEIKEISAKSGPVSVSSILSAVLERSQPLIGTTRFRSKQKRSARALGVTADKQNLADTFALGHLLVDIIDSLPLEVIYGPLPAVIRTRDGRSIKQWSWLRDPETVVCFQPGYKNKKCIETVLKQRAAWEAEHSPRTRNPLINLRLLAEMMLFIGQTGMNLSQAINLKVTQYAYESTIDGYKVYDYKDRARKAVLFEIFTDYKHVFEDYLILRKKLFGDTTDLLFPFVRSRGGTKHSQVTTKRLREEICKPLGIPWVSPRLLRNTRINWLLRESRDPDLTAAKAQHLKQTLIQIYEKPSLQVAMREIVQFHQKCDPRLGGTLTPCPGLGICDGIPQPLPSLPPVAPKPDCTHPAGCLFCGHHRDIDSEDYVWSTASMRHLNTLLLRRFRPGDKGQADPAANVELVLEVLTRKLKWFEDSNTKRKAWVAEALEKLAEGDFHLHWRYLIESAEGV